MREALLQDIYDAYGREPRQPGDFDVYEYMAFASAKGRRVSRSTASTHLKAAVEDGRLLEIPSWVNGKAGVVYRSADDSAAEAEFGG